MKRLFTSALLALSSFAALAATLAPVQLLNPTGSTAGQAIVSNGSGSAPTWQAVTATALGPVAANTLIGNKTGSSAAPTAVAIPSCSTANSALQWTSGTGPACGTTFALTSGTLAQFAATTSAQLAGVISNETGSGVLVFGTSPTLTTPNIVGTTAADNAAAGSVGEHLTNSATGTALTTATPNNSVTRSLTAGDWEVQCVNTFNPAGSTTVTLLQTGVSTVSANFGTPNAGAFVLLQSSLVTGGTQVQASPPVHVNVSSTTTVYCVANAQFGVSTMTVDGFIRAHRLR